MKGGYSLCSAIASFTSFPQDISVALVALIPCITQSSGLLGYSRKSLCQFLMALWKASLQVVLVDNGTCLLPIWGMCSLTIDCRAYHVCAQW